MDSTTLIVVCAAGVVLLFVLLFALRSRGKKELAAAQTGATEKATADSRALANQEPARVPTAKPTPLPTPVPRPVPPPAPTPPEARSLEARSLEARIDARLEEQVEDIDPASAELDVVTAPIAPMGQSKIHADPVVPMHTAETVRPPDALKIDLAPPSQPQDEATKPIVKPSAPRIEAPRPARPDTAGDTKPLVPRVEDRKRVPSAPKIDAPKPAPSAPKVEAVKAAPNLDVKPDAKLDVGGLDVKPKPAPKPAETKPATPQARLVIPSNPATAELEKNDPRHAAARRFARVAVSEIKLYHEEEVAAGRAAKDLWTRLHSEISLARQTYDGRVDKTVRERFDYLYDEIIRQLAEGELEKLGPEAPKPKAQVGAATGTKPESDAKITAPAATKRDAAPPPPLEPTPVEPAPVEASPMAPSPMEEEAPTRKHALLEDTSKAAEAPAAKLPARFAPPTSAETAELEKSDPRHAAARRFARVSVSEIKLYHEDEVAAGRAAKDLWTRLHSDIGLARQTFDARVDKEVRARFDYLYDEILRQLAEGDVDKLGPDAPKPKVSSERNLPAVVAAVAQAPAAPAPAAPVPAPAPSPSPSGANVVDIHTTHPSPVNRYAPPLNPATADLEKSDPRHAAARRLARLSISEIKLYHEDEVKQGREAKDLWRRFSSDIALATQTFDRRVDKEVRERFDYLYDEIVRQLAEGDVDKLGTEAPKRAIS